ncbi:MAG: segregation/condensation protein A [Gemella sp.]|nr:segregation/condensation protein A [Gemella sp.]
MYKVNLEVFQGPLDVLLHLIEKMEIDIHNVKISQLTEEYLEYIKSLDEISIENAEEYIVMAATLIHIKSKRLLPQQETEVAAEDVESEEDLLQRLIEYKNYKEMQDVFYSMQEERQDFGDKENQDLIIESRLMEMSAQKLQLAFKRIISNKKLEKQAEESIRYRKEISLPKIKDDILYQINIEGKEYLEDIISAYETREEIVACFICTLDMLRDGLIDTQENGEKLKIILL